MRVLLIGATGTIGRAIREELRESHSVVCVNRTSTPLSVDLDDHASIPALFAQLDGLEAIICAAGSARFKPLHQLGDEDLGASIHNKLMGQVQVIRHGISALQPGGSITVTTGQLAQHPMAGGAALSLVNAALEGFVRAAALEAPHGLRINAVSPGWVRPAGQPADGAAGGGMAAEQVALAYRQLLEGQDTGRIVQP